MNVVLCKLPTLRLTKGAEHTYLGMHRRITTWQFARGPASDLINM
jgi:hypothetical protein